MELEKVRARCRGGRTNEQGAAREYAAGESARPLCHRVESFREKEVTVLAGPDADRIGAAGRSAADGVSASKIQSARRTLMGIFGAAGGFVLEATAPGRDVQNTDADGYAIVTYVGLAPGGETIGRSKRGRHADRGGDDNHDPAVPSAVN